MALIVALWIKFDLKISITTAEEYYMFSVLFRPPWTKAMALGLALICAEYYIWFSEVFRQMPEER